VHILYSLLLRELGTLIDDHAITSQGPGQAQHVVKEHTMGANIQAMGPQASAQDPLCRYIRHPSHSVRHTDLRVSQVHEIATEKLTSGFIS
jgi:hypothetical protein